MRIKRELDFWLAAALLIFSVVGATVGCTDIGPIDPETGKNYRPWNEDPYAIGPDAHFMDRKFWQDPDAAERQEQYNNANEPRDIGDYLFRN